MLHKSPQVWCNQWKNYEIREYLHTSRATYWHHHKLLAHQDLKSSIRTLLKNHIRFPLIYDEPNSRSDITIIQCSIETPNNIILYWNFAPKLLQHSFVNKSFWYLSHVLKVQLNTFYNSRLFWIITITVDF